MKTWRIDAFFPEVKPAQDSQHGCVVSADEMSTGARRGLDQILARGELRGKRISIAKVSIIEIKGGRPETVVVTKGAAA